nr:hypothetical protein A6C57_01315 [Fibrella sp. ES10-3-2-2]
MEPKNGDTNESGEVYEDGYWLPANSGLLDRSAQTPSRAEQIRAKIYKETPVLEPVAQSTPVRRPEPPTESDQRQSLYNTALHRLSGRYAQKPLWRPLLTVEQGCDLLDWIAREELAKQGRTLSEEPVDIDLMFNLLLWFWRDRRCPYDLNRGIFLYGPVGIGKTFVFDCFKILFDTIAPPAHQFQVVGTAAMMNEVAAKKSFAALNPYRSGGLVMDDLGQEEGVASAYGDRRDAFGELLTHRHRLFTQDRVFTHFTSNLLPDELGSQDYYGARLGDRFYEWVQCVHYDTTISKRLPGRTQ